MITIGAVSRQTGIAAQTLRKWQERYGFPVPERTESGHRIFHERDVKALLEIARRLAAGERPSRAISEVQRELRSAGAQHKTSLDSIQNSVVALALRYLTEGDLIQLERLIESKLLEYGVGKFSHDVAFPLMEAVGALWQEGTLPIYAEHAFTSIMQRVMFGYSKPATAKLSDQCFVLFASPPGELHNMALTMGNALFNKQGVASVMLFGGMPTAEIANAAIAYKAGVVALSASICYPPKLLKLELQALRKLLPASVSIWLGGSGANRMAGQIDGIDIMTSWDEALRKQKDKKRALGAMWSTYSKDFDG